MQRGLHARRDALTPQMLGRFMARRLQKIKVSLERACHPSTVETLPEIELNFVLDPDDSWFQPSATGFASISATSDQPSPHLHSDAQLRHASQERRVDLRRGFSGQCVQDAKAITQLETARNLVGVKRAHEMTCALATSW